MQLELWSSMLKVQTLSEFKFRPKLIWLDKSSRTNWRHLIDRLIAHVESALARVIYRNILECHSCDRAVFRWMFCRMIRTLKFGVQTTLYDLTKSFSKFTLESCPYERRTNTIVGNKVDAYQSTLTLESNLDRDDRSDRKFRAIFAIAGQF